MPNARKVYIMITGFPLNMADNNGSSTQKSDVGREVVSGLEDTLAWIKTQFQTFKNDVETTEQAASASSWRN
jgi:hypothetical protein